MTNKHTPAPWEYVEETISVEGIGGWEVAFFGKGGKFEERHKADAQLIAAAPELLAIIEEAVACLKDERSIEYRSLMYRKLVKVIKKAKGE